MCGSNRKRMAKSDSHGADFAGRGCRSLLGSRTLHALNAARNSAPAIPVILIVITTSKSMNKHNQQEAAKARKRREHLLMLRQRGFTNTEIAAVIGRSKQRVSQIINRRK
jgi:DNA-binding NarL/FixJ family response regulator